MSDGSAGARTIAVIATNNGFELSRYRAAKLMVKLKLEAAKCHNINITGVEMSILKSQIC